MRGLLPILLFVLLVVSCDDRRLGEVLTTADSLLAEQPDSALQYLEAHEVLKPEGSRSQRMRYELLRATAQNKAYVDFTSDSVMKEVVDYYDDHGTANEQLQAHYLLGCVYRDLGDAPRAIECYLDAVEKADTTAEDCDYRTMGATYSQMADMYHRQLLLNNEIEARKQASHYSFVAGDTLISIYDYKMIAGSYILQSKNDSAEIILKETMVQFRKRGKEQEAIQTSTMLMHIYTEQPEHMSELKSLLEEYDAKSDLFDENHELPPSKRQYYYYKGRYYEHLNQLDSAELYYRKIYRPNMSHMSANPMYKGLLSVYQKKNKSDSIAKYAELYCISNDSSSIIKDQELTAKMSASYNYSRHQRLAEQRKRELAGTRRNAAIGIAMLLLMLCLIVYFNKRYQTKKRIEINALTRNLIAAEEELEKARKAQSVEKDIESLESQLAALRQEKVQVRQADLEKAFFRTPIYETFHRLSVHRVNQIPPTDSDWEEMSKLFAHHFPAYYHFIHQEHRLSPEQERYAMMVRLGFDDQQIGIIMDKDRKRINNIKALIGEKIWSEKSAKQVRDRLNGHFLNMMDK